MPCYVTTAKNFPSVPLLLLDSTTCGMAVDISWMVLKTYERVQVNHLFPTYLHLSLYIGICR